MMVVVCQVLGQDLLEMTTTEDEEPSRHSRQTVSTKRSANAFARGAGTGFLMIGG
jgi:hypothetical protein